MLWRIILHIFLTDIRRWRLRSKTLALGTCAFIRFDRILYVCWLLITALRLASARTITEPPFYNFTALIFKCSFLPSLDYRSIRKGREMSRRVYISFWYEKFCIVSIAIAQARFWSTFFVKCHNGHTFLPYHIELRDARCDYQTFRYLRRCQDRQAENHNMKFQAQQDLSHVCAKTFMCGIVMD